MNYWWILGVYLIYTFIKFTHELAADPTSLKSKYIGRFKL